MQYHAATTVTPLSLWPRLEHSVIVAALAGLLVPALVPAETPESLPEVVPYYEQQLAWLEEEASYISDESEQWPALLAEFKQQFAQRKNSLVPNLPPLGGHNRITDFEVFSDGLGLYWAEWTYVNTGDFNLSGTVDYQDLLTLYYNLGSAVGDEGWNPARNCDGNGDGVIDAQDLKVIVDNYGNSVLYYRVVSDALPPQGHPSSIYRTLELSHLCRPAEDRPVLGTVNSQTRERPLSAPPQYKCELDMRKASVFIWVEPVAAQLDSASNVAGEDRLTVRLNARQRCGFVPLEVTLDCSGSIGQEYYSWTKPFVDVEWDVNGDAVFNATPEELRARGEKECPVVFTQPLCRLASVRITDLDGTEGTAQLPLTVVLKQPLPEHLGDLTFINARPCYAYTGQAEDGQLELWFVSATDETAREWCEPQLVTTTAAGPAPGISLAVINGRPALAYLVVSETDRCAALYFASALDDNGEAWREPVLIDNNVVADQFSVAPLLELAGCPALAYTRWTAANAEGERGQEMLFRTAQDAGGQHWGDPRAIVTVSAEDLNSIQAFTSPKPSDLKLIDGRPALLFHGYTMYGGSTSLALAQDRQGTSWEEPQGIHQSLGGNTGGGGLASGLLELAGAPAWLKYSWSRGTYGSQSSYTLHTGLGPSALTLDPRELPVSGVSHFFGSGSDSSTGIDEMIAAVPFNSPAGEAGSALALVSLRCSTTAISVNQGNAPHGATRLSIAYSTDGAAWKLSPTFTLEDDIYTLIGGQCRRLKDELTGTESLWLQLFFTVETGQSQELWITHVPINV